MNTSVRNQLNKEVITLDTGEYRRRRERYNSAPGSCGVQKAGAVGYSSHHVAALTTAHVHSRGVSGSRVFGVRDGFPAKITEIYTKLDSTSRYLKSRY